MNGGIKPLYDIDTRPKSEESYGRVMQYARGLQPQIEQPKPTVGQGLMTGLSGAAAGAQVGSMIAPGPGTAIGAGLGTVAGLLSAFG
jgi:hypothetical protein